MSSKPVQMLAGCPPVRITTITDHRQQAMAPRKTATSAVSKEPATSPTTSAKSGRANWDEVLHNIYQYYTKQTPQRTKLIDVFLLFLAVVGGLQFLYCVLAGNYVRDP